MANSFRLRLELPDRPGALALVARVLAEVGANITSVDIHELDGDTAVDEIVVSTPDSWEPSVFAAALERTGAATLLSSAANVASRDPIVWALSWSAAMVAAGADASELELGRAVLELTGAPAAWVCEVDEAVRYEAGRLALERGSPVIQKMDPAQAATHGFSGTIWVLAAADGYLDSQIVAFAVRPLALRFTPVEVARVEALLGLRRQFLASVSI